MKNVSFGKEEDCPIPKKNDDELSDDNDLDLEDDNEQIQKENINNKSSSKLNEEIELNQNSIKNKKVIFSSESEVDDSDKSNKENDQNNKNQKNNIKEKKYEEDKKEENNDEDNNKRHKKNENSDEESSNNNKIIEKSDSEKEKVKESEDEDEKDKVKKPKNNKNKEKEDDEFMKKISKNKEIESLLIQSIKNKENATSQKIQMAEEIDFKSIPDKIITTDQYGFIIDNNREDKNQETSNLSRKSTQDLLQLNARIEKWNYMLEHYEEYSKKKLGKLKSRTRKGIPDCLRSYVWQIFGEEKKYYQKDLFKKLDSEKLNEETEIVIIKDLDRTFPACQFFKEKYGNGQRKLYKVLSNYSKYNTATGYVQGMGFITAVFLTYMDEESSFFMLDSLMKKYGLEGYYEPNFPKLKSTFYIMLNLLKKFIPKVYELFKKEGMIPSMYASEWFICLFSRNLEFNALVRIFDVFLLEGYKVIYRFVLAFLKLKEDKFLTGKDGLASIMQTLNDCYNIDDIEKLFQTAFGFSFSRKDINKLENDYETVKNDKENEFIKQL